MTSDEQGALGLQQQLPIQFGEFEKSDFADSQSQVDKALESDTHSNDNNYYEESDYDYDEGMNDEEDYGDTQTFEEWRLDFERSYDKAQKKQVSYELSHDKDKLNQMKNYQEKWTKVLSEFRSMLIQKFLMWKKN